MLTLITDQWGITKRNFMKDKIFLSAMGKFWSPNHHTPLMEKFKFNKFIIFQPPTTEITP